MWPPRRGFVGRQLVDLATDARGIAGFRLQLDGQGRPIGLSFLDTQDLATRVEGVGSVHLAYQDSRQMASMDLLGLRGERSSFGAWQSTRYFDADGEPAADEDGCHQISSSRTCLVRLSDL